MKCRIFWFLSRLETKTWFRNRENNGKIYEKDFGSKPHVVACHAGLECGIIGANYPEMEMVSFGPTIRGAHSPDEKANIPSVQKFWGFLKEILEKAESISVPP
jgi:di/tripeptidase